MGIYIVSNKLLRTTKSNNFGFGLPNNADDNLEHEINSVVKHNEFVAENTIEYEVKQSFRVINLEKIFKNTENSKMNEPHKCFLNLSQRLDLRSSNKHFALRNLSIYYI